MVEGPSFFRAWGRVRLGVSGKLEMEVRSGRRPGVMGRTLLASLNLSPTLERCSSRTPVRDLGLDRRTGRETEWQVAKT